VDIKRCARCRLAAYCGAACQKAAWKAGHKSSCVFLSPDQLTTKLEEAAERSDWHGVLSYETRIEDVLPSDDDELCENLLSLFGFAHGMMMTERSTLGQRKESMAHAARSAVHEERRIEILGRMQRFRDQGEAMDILGSTLFTVGKEADAERWMLRARQVGADHGFFTVECRACAALGNLYMQDGREAEGLDLLRNAVAAATLDDTPDRMLETTSLQSLADALLRSMPSSLLLSSLELSDTNV